MDALGPLCGQGHELDDLAVPGGLLVAGALRARGRQGPRFPVSRCAPPPTGRPPARPPPAGRPPREPAAGRRAAPGPVARRAAPGSVARRGTLPTGCWKRPSPAPRNAAPGPVAPPRNSPHRMLDAAITGTPQSVRRRRPPRCAGTVARRGTLPTGGWKRPPAPRNAAPGTGRPPRNSPHRMLEAAITGTRNPFGRRRPPRHTETVVGRAAPGPVARRGTLPTGRWKRLSPAPPQSVRRRRPPRPHRDRRRPHCTGPVARRGTLPTGRWKRSSPAPRNPFGGGVDVRLGGPAADAEPDRAVTDDRRDPHGREHRRDRAFSGVARGTG